VRPPDFHESSMSMIYSFFSNVFSFLVLISSAVVLVNGDLLKSQMQKTPPILEKFKLLQIQYSHYQSTQKYLVYLCNNRLGLGNKFLGLISSFILAVLTNRAFVMDWTLEPPYTEIFQFQNIPSPDPLVPQLRKLYFTPSAYWLSFTTHSLDIPIEVALCEDLTNLTHHLLVVTSWNYFVPLLQQNPHYRDKLRQWFGDDLFGSVFRFLIKPSAALQPRIDEMMNQFHIWRQQGKLISGVQLRQGEPLKGDRFISEDAEQTMFKCIKYISDSKSEKNGTIYVIATDNRFARNSAVEALGTNATFFMIPEDLVVIDPWRKTHSLSKATLTAVVQGAFLEMWMLGEVDELIVTSYSTFGYVASGRVSRVPLTVIYTFYSLIQASPVCVRLAHSQPLCHFCHSNRRAIVKSRCYTTDMTIDEVFFLSAAQGYSTIYDWWTRFRLEGGILQIASFLCFLISFLVISVLFFNRWRRRRRQSRHNRTSSK